MDLHVEERGTTFCVTTQAFSLELLDTPVNRKVAVVFLRVLKDSHGRPLFTLEQLAAIVGSANRQAASQHVEDFRASGADFKALATRKRKVDQAVVEAVAHELTFDPLASLGELVSRVNARLKRDDLTPANIEAGLEQLSAASLRKVVQTQLARGAVHYQEEVLLEMALTALQSATRQEQTQVVARLERAQIEGSRDTGMTSPHPDEATLTALCRPHTPLSAIPWALQVIVVCLTLYSYGVPLRVLGRWVGVHKTTMLRWIVGLAAGVWSLIATWITQAVKGRVVYLDEKWLKIQGTWVYWFVALDGETELPIAHELMTGRKGWHCVWLLVKLKRLGLGIKVVVTDGLKGYLGAIPRVFPQAVHQLCLFHHQQRVSQFAREHFAEEEERKARQTAMKKLVQTHDKRTVKNRLAALQARAHTWGIGEWLKRMEEVLPHLLPAVGSRRIPRTTNAIERFFRAFQRFYKVRRGFFSRESAKGQLLVFLVFYVFTQGEKGSAPIERVIPEARAMPLYRLMNDPFMALGLGVRPVKETPSFAKDHLKKAA